MRSALKRRKEAVKLLGRLGRGLRKAYRRLGRAVRRASGKVTVHWLNWRRLSCESVGIGAYSRMALHDLDTRLERHLPQWGGVEAGAHDGVKFSNTYYFEKIKGWRGILVEPIGELAAQCGDRRKRSRVVQAAGQAAELDNQVLRKQAGETAKKLDEVERGLEKAVKRLQHTKATSSPRWRERVAKWLGR